MFDPKKPITTRKGIPVRVVVERRQGANAEPYSLGVVRTNGFAQDTEQLYWYKQNGEFSMGNGGPSEFDLINPPEMLDGWWMNFYGRLGDHGNQFCITLRSRLAADSTAGFTGYERLACVFVQPPAGEGLEVAK